MGVLGSQNKPLAFEGEFWQPDVYAAAQSEEGSFRIERLNVGFSGPSLVLIFTEADGSETTISSYKTGNAGSNVKEAVRINLDDGSNETYFFPIADVSVAAYPHLRVQHNGSTYAFHDSTSAPKPITIPDESDLSFNYDFSASEDTSSVPDATGKKPTLTGGTFSTDTKNGIQVASFDDSSGQELSGSFASGIDLPVHIFWVAKSDTTIGSHYLWSHDNEGWHVEGSEWSWYDGSSSYTFGSSDTNWHIFDMLIESGSFDFGVDGGPTTTVSSSNASLSEFVIGTYGDGNDTWDGDCALILCYDQDKTTKRSDITNALGSIYEISLD